MIGLDYFLDDKSLNKILKDLDNGIYYSSIPKTYKEKIRFNLSEQIEGDRYLYNYLNAYNIKKMDSASSEMRVYDLSSLLILDGGFENYTPKEVRKTVVEMISGRRPVSKDEKLIWNVVEAYNLIQQDKFEINDDNYELFIHVIFRNIGLDLDNKRNYYRNSLKDKTFLKQTVKIEKIDEELQALFDYIYALRKTPLAGFTQAYLIIISVMMISPYKKHNLIIAVLLSQWYMHQANGQLQLIFPGYAIGNKISELIKTIDESFSNRMNISEPLKLLKKFAKREINVTYRLHMLNKWIAEEPIKRQKLVSDNETLMVLLTILSIRDKEVSFSRIKQDLMIGTYEVLNKEQLQKSLTKLENNQLLVKKGTASAKYLLNDDDLYKIKRLLKD